MVFITAKAYENTGVDVIKDNNNYFWIKMKDVKDGLGIKNIYDSLRREIQGIFETKKVAKEQKRQYVKTKNEINKDIKNSKYTYVRNDIAGKVIKNCRSVKRDNNLDKKNQRESFRELLGFTENEIFESKEYSIVKKIKKVVINQKMIDHYRIDKYFIDLYFPELKLEIEIDENGHLDRLKIKDMTREEIIKNLGITLVRINLDKEGFDIFDKMFKSFIYESDIKIVERLKKNKMIEDLERSLKIIKMSG